jgi:hypothetical protein
MEDTYVDLRALHKARLKDIIERCFLFFESQHVDGGKKGSKNLWKKIGSIFLVISMSFLGICARHASHHGLAFVKTALQLL